MNAPLDENNYQWQPAQPSALRYLWNHPIVIAGVMGMLLLLVTAVSIIAIKAVGDDRTAQAPRNGGGQPGTNQANPAPAGSTPATGNPATGAPATGGTAPAANATNAVYLSGKLTLHYFDSGVDLDTAKTSGLSSGEKYDFDVTETGLTGANRGQAGVGATGTPSPEGCAAATVKWGAAAHISVLAPGALICVKTSDDRLGAFSVAKLDKSDGGQLRQLDLDYVVWKKPGDL